MLRLVRADTRGTSLVEYLVVVGCIAVIAIAGVRRFGDGAAAKAEAQAGCIERIGAGSGCGQGSAPEGGTGHAPVAGDGVPGRAVLQAVAGPLVRAATHKLDGGTGLFGATLTALAAVVATGEIGVGGKVPAVAPPPVALFPDGSVRTVNPDIDPTVLNQLQQGGRAPVPETVHVPGAPWGKTPPTNDRPWTLPPNWEFGVGEVIYSYQSIEIGRGRGAKSPQQVYDELKVFKHFDKGNLATVRIVHPGALEPADVDRARTFGVFRVKLKVSEVGFKDATLNNAQLLVNYLDVNVELFYDDANKSITAVTLGPHMIVGVRKWTVKGNVVETEAWEQRNGRANDKAMTMAGKAAMAEIWKRYLGNIAEASGGAGAYREAWDSRPEGSGNPFRAGLPGSKILGPALPPGYGGAGAGVRK